MLFDLLLEQVAGVLISVTLELLVDGAAGDGFVEVHLVAVEIGAVNAGELGLAANGQTAAAAHTGTVHHDGAHGNGAGQVVLLGGHGDELLLCSDFVLIHMSLQAQLKLS